MDKKDVLETLEGWTNGGTDMWGQFWQVRAYLASEDVFLQVMIFLETKGIFWKIRAILEIRTFVWCVCLWKVRRSVDSFEEGCLWLFVLFWYVSIFLEMDKILKCFCIFFLTGVDIFFYIWGLFWHVKMFVTDNNFERRGKRGHFLQVSTFLAGGDIFGKIGQFWQVRMFLKCWRKIRASTSGEWGHIWQVKMFFASEDHFKKWGHFLNYIFGNKRTF